jgi:hypothetical protein
MPDEDGVVERAPDQRDQAKRLRKLLHALTVPLSRTSASEQGRRRQPLTILADGQAATEPIRFRGMALDRTVQDWPVAARSDRHIATAMSAAVAPVTIARTPAIFA